jgi:hypothetical protein
MNMLLHGVENANLAPTEMEIDGTIFHGWLLLCALSALIPWAAQASTTQGQPAASSHLMKRRGMTFR